MLMEGLKRGKKAAKLGFDVKQMPTLTFMPVITYFIGPFLPYNL
jgi:hypothetical protein